MNQYGGFNFPQTQQQVQDVTIDMNTHAGGAASFFTGPKQADYRVQEVLNQAEDDFYREKDRQSQLDEYYRRQKHQEHVEQQLHQHEMSQSAALMQQRKEQEQSMLLDKQVMFMNKKDRMEQENRNLDCLKALTMTGQQPQFNMATMSGN